MASKRPKNVRRITGIVVATAVVTAGATTASVASAAEPGKAAASAFDGKRPTLPSDAVAHRFTKGLRSLPKTGSYAFLLTLDTTSTVAVTQRSRGRSRAAVKRATGEQRSRIARLQRDVAADLPGDSTVLYRTHALTAGLAVRTDVRNASRLETIKGVTGVYPISPKKLSNSYAVPRQGAPHAWATYGDRGQKSSVAIIDTGVDYTHSDFGGPGTSAAYATAKSPARQTDTAGIFPTEKVIGGYDFVGDAYDPDSDDTAAQTPHPDANPLDCEGHGSHVAGSAAGYGTNADGSTYTGSYSATTPFGNLHIGPGMAPEAKIYAYKVFGCEGGSDFAGAALDRAIDPNQDGDTSDHVDVANLSLGSDFVPPGGDGDAVLVQKASAAGVTVVAAAGNAGDVYDVAGSPANEPSAISVAASRDAQAVVDALNLTTPAAQYPANRSVAYDYKTKPDLAGNVAKLSSANATGCAALTPPDAAAVNGKIAFLEWHDAAPECGSVARAGNVAAAGAIGFVFGSDSENFSTGITGSAAIPGVLVAKSGADAIRSRLQAGTAVTVGSTTANGVKQQDTSLNDTLTDFSSRGVRGKDGLKPDVAAIGDTVFSAASGTGTEGVTESGTSMATPMTAGLAALLRSQHPEWTPAEVKADIMNTTGQDVYTGPNHSGTKYGPNRVGAGRIDAAAAVDNSVLAYTTGTGVPAGTVSASFGPVEVTKDTTLTKTITVQNTELTTATFSTGFDERTTTPGATFTVTPSTVTVGPRGKATVTVSLTLVRSALTKTIDPTVAREQSIGNGVTVPRQYVADTSGLVTLTPTAGSDVALRVPVYAAPRPASVMTQPTSVKMPAGAITSTPLSLTGTPVANGSGDTAVASTVAGFELQASSGKAPTCTTKLTSRCVANEAERSGDLKYVGTTSSAPLLREVGDDPLTSNSGLAYFAVSMQAPWRTATGFQSVEIYIDSTGDNVADSVTYTTRAGTADSPTDVMLAVTESLTDQNADLDIEPINDTLGDVDTALFDSDTLVVPVRIGALAGVSSSRPRIRYSVLSYAGTGGRVVDAVGDVNDDTGELVAPKTMDVLRPGVALYGTGGAGRVGNSPLLYGDKPGSSLKIRRDVPAYVADGATGALLTHLHNGLGSKARVVSFAPQPSTVSLRLSPATVRHGKKVTASVTVRGQTGQLPTGTVLLRRYGPGKAVANIARATLRSGNATLSFTAARKGTFVYRIQYSGDRFNAAVLAGRATSRVT